MRRVVVLALLALALPIAAWADTIDITNRYGSVSLSSAGISANSQMGSYNNILVSKGHALGYVNFGTGAFSGSSLKGNGTFSSAGSWFDITGRGQVWRAERHHLLRRFCRSNRLDTDQPSGEWR